MGCVCVTVVLVGARGSMWELLASPLLLDRQWGKELRALSPLAGQRIVINECLGPTGSSYKTALVVDPLQTWGKSNSLGCRGIINRGGRTQASPRSSVALGRG